MAKITVISPSMEAHLGDCADIAKAVKAGRGEQYAESFEGLNLLGAIEQVDAEWADQFGETPYQEGATHWGIFNMDVKPCLLNAMRTAGIAIAFAGEPRSEGWGRPFYGEQTLKNPTPAAPATGTCQCGCGGSPKGRKSRFLPGHDMRVGHGDRSPASRPTEAKGGASPGKPDKASRLRCRATGKGVSLVTSVQCRNPAKGERSVPDYMAPRGDHEGIPMTTIAVCGVHKNMKTTPSIYYKREGSSYERPVQVWM